MTRTNAFDLDEGPATPPRFDAPSVKLETRGTTQPFSQGLLWSQGTIHKNTTAAKLRAAGKTEEAAKLEHCHTVYTVAVCKGCNTVHKFPNRCDLFYCAECQPRLSADRRKAVEWWTREVRQPKHVVLTVQNLPQITKAHVQQVRRWFTNLRRTAFARSWRGGFYSLEVTNEGRGWHVHIHALVDAQWIDSFGLSEHWQKVTNNMGRIVKVKDARQSNYLKEVTKYCVKGVQLAAWSPETIVQFVQAFTGVRTFGVFGSLYGARTEFREWWKLVRDNKPPCKCGCAAMNYYTESEFLALAIQPQVCTRPIPPPPTDATPLLPLNLPSPRFY